MWSRLSIHRYSPSLCHHHVIIYEILKYTSIYLERLYRARDKIEKCSLISQWNVVVHYIQITFHWDIRRCFSILYWHDLFEFAERLTVKTLCCFMKVPLGTISTGGKWRLWSMSAIHRWPLKNLRGLSTCWDWNGQVLERQLLRTDLGNWNPCACCVDNS